MKYLTILLALVLMTLAGCKSSQSMPSQFKDIKDPIKLEKAVYKHIGDVRVFYYVKGRLVRGTSGGDVEQKESKFVLINKSHYFYKNMPEHQIPKHEMFLSDSDMYNLLTVLKHKTGFFESGVSINILSEDPIQRANSEASTTRIIAIQQIKNGKVNTSYFHRRSLEHKIDKDRARKFNYSQDYVIGAVRTAAPRGSAGAGNAGSGSGHNIFDQ